MAQGIKCLERTIERILARLWPRREYVGTFMGTVVGVHTSGGKMHEMHPGYAIDIKPDDERFPVIPDVPVPVLWAGQNRGIYALPAKGSKVVFAFADADPSKPYVVVVLGYGHDAPEHPTDTLIIAQNDSVSIEIGADGHITVKGEGITLDGHGVPKSGVVTQSCKCAFTGGPHIEASQTVEATQ